MLGIDARAARAAWTVFLVALALLLLYLIRETLVVFTLAVLVAYLIAPIVNLADKARPKKLPRTLTLAAVYILILAVLIVGSSVLGARVADEAYQLAGKIPNWLAQNDPRTWQVPVWIEPFKATALATVRSQLDNNAKDVVPVVHKIGQGVLSVLGNLGFVVLVPILSFFFLKDAAGIRDRILGMLAGQRDRAFIEEVTADVHVLLGQYMRALVLLAAATCVIYALFFLITGVPYAALLAGLAGVLEFIPVLGPLCAAAAALLVAAFSGKLALLPWMLLFLVAYRLWQDYVVQPYLMSAGVALHPLWIIFGVLAGGQIAGVAGMFLSIPVLAILRIVVVRVRKAREASKAAS